MIDSFRISALIGYLTPAAGEIGKHQSKDITMSNDEKPDNSPDALVEKILYLNATTPGGFPPEMREKAPSHRPRSTTGSASSAEGVLQSLANAKKGT